MGQHVRFQEGGFDAVQRLRVQASDIVRVLGVDDTEQGGHILDVAANRTSGIIVLDQRNHLTAVYYTLAGYMPTTPFQLDGMISDPAVSEPTLTIVS